ncbi:MAG: class I SAM-dependent methyltransferase [Phycisphaerales bacterium]|nr:MAG: class I SAM-dependent methyltransferase [Phycisphaerales bacterium]
MPIGSAYSRISGNRLSALVIRCLGTLDLHTHLRLKPILGFFRDHVQAGSSCRVLEVGCGDGVNAFELARLARREGVTLSYLGLDIDPEGLEKARRLAQVLELDRDLQFLRSDASHIASLGAEAWDMVILADVLEHIEAPEALLRDIRPALRTGGLCLVSVPTPNYERVFGSAFHQKIGHVRSGYRIEELNALFAEIGGRVICHSYSTGLISRLGCAVYYRTPATRRVTALKAILLSPFRVLDFYNGPRVSCSLFAAYCVER